MSTNDDTIGDVQMDGEMESKESDPQLDDSHIKGSENRTSDVPININPLWGGSEIKPTRFVVLVRN